MWVSQMRINHHKLDNLREIGIMDTQAKSAKKWVLLMLLFVAMFLPKHVVAASPWQWDRVLRNDNIKDSMIKPTALFIDEGKAVYYVVDSGKNRLISYNREGQLISSFNAGGALETPFDMVKTAKSGIWVVEKGKNALSFIDLQKKEVTPHFLKYKGNVVYPDRLETAAGLLYVLNKVNGEIIRYSTLLEADTRYSCSDCHWGFVDFKIHNEKLWALDQAGKAIVVFDLQGKQVQRIELGGTIIFPVSLDIGPAGLIYVVDRQRRNVSVYTKNGSFKYSFLDKGVARGQLYYPSEIRFDPWGGLCLVDEGNGKVEILKR